MQDASFKQQTKQKYKPNHQQTGLPPHSALPIRGKTNKNSAQISPYMMLTQTTGPILGGQKPKERKNSTLNPGKLVSHFSRVRLCVTLETAAHQALLCLGFSRQENCLGCHFLLQCMKVKSESEVASHVRLLATPWTASYQAPPSMGFF